MMHAGGEEGVQRGIRDWRGGGKVLKVLWPQCGAQRHVQNANVTRFFLKFTTRGQPGAVLHTDSCENILWIPRGPGRLDNICTSQAEWNSVFKTLETLETGFLYVPLKGSSAGVFFPASVLDGVLLFFCRIKKNRVLGSRRPRLICWRALL